jgi:hypothetical protein
MTVYSVVVSANAGPQCTRRLDLAQIFLSLDIYTCTYAIISSQFPYAQVSNKGLTLPFSTLPMALRGKVATSRITFGTL